MKMFFDIISLWILPSIIMFVIDWNKPTADE